MKHSTFFCQEPVYKAKIWPQVPNHILMLTNHHCLYDQMGDAQSGGKCKSIYLNIHTTTKKIFFPLHHILQSLPFGKNPGKTFTSHMSAQHVCTPCTHTQTHTHIRYNHMTQYNFNDYWQTWLCTSNYSWIR